MRDDNNPRLTGELCLGIIWNNRSDYEDTDWTSVVEFAGHVVKCFGDEHGGGEISSWCEYCSCQMALRLGNLISVNRSCV
jgi:hypothetical protein